MPDNKNWVASVSTSDANNNFTAASSFNATTSTNSFNVNAVSQGHLNKIHTVDVLSRGGGPTIDMTCPGGSSTLSVASMKSPVSRRHSYSPGNGISVYGGCFTSSAMHVGSAGPMPSVTLVDAACDKTTPAITMTMAPGDECDTQDTSMGAMLLPNYSPGASFTSPLMMDWYLQQSVSQSSFNSSGYRGVAPGSARRYSHEIPRDFAIPSMLQSYALPGIDPNMVPGKSLTMSSSSAALQHNFSDMSGAASSMFRSFSMPRDMSSLAAATADGTTDNNLNMTSSCFSISDLHLEAGMQGYPTQDCSSTSGDVMPPGFPLSVGGGDLSGFPLTGIPGSSGNFMPQLAMAGGQEWLLPLESFFFSGFQCLESLAGGSTVAIDNKIEQAMVS
ncbi:hypothetical protein ElyMa_003818000 [Elysia marginata]|uniref:Uncharacterized protein n=1 Tax=Elysia marginata TaxID=1093978 RepID=A0AAV4FGV0_9GAST|nr:hypothetical protein ElyMa_003818000 [Elysia marginata]